MIFSRQSSAIYEARIADLKEAHEARVNELMKLVDVLAEQIDYLRIQVMASGKPMRQTLNPDASMPVPMERAFMSEEEEDILALHEAGHLSELELEEALARAGFSNTHIT